jgi:hypothetical protein
MKMSGDSVRVAQPLFPVEGQGSIPMSPLQFEIVEVHYKIAKQLNKLWHSRLPIFSTGAVPRFKVNYAAVYKNIYFATAIWGMPISPALPHHTWLELKRFAICDDAPKNTATRMIKIMTFLIKDKFPKVTRLISYQDTDSHDGIIYKASNWQETAHSSGGININFSMKRNLLLKNNLNNTSFSPKIRWEKQIRQESEIKVIAIKPPKKPPQKGLFF